MPIKTEIHGGAHLENKLTHNYPFLLFADHLTVFTLKSFTVEAIIKKMPSKKRKEKRKKRGQNLQLLGDLRSYCSQMENPLNLF